MGWRPYLIFDFILVSHQFNPTPYFTTNKDRKSIQEKVWELHNEGWEYTKIHTYLIEKGFQIGKSRTCVDSMIKKRTKRELILNQPILVDKYVDLHLGVLKNWIRRVLNSTNFRWGLGIFGLNGWMVEWKIN